MANITKVTNHQTAPSNMLSYVVQPFSAGEIGVFASCLSLEVAHYEVDNKRAAVCEAVRALFGDEAPTFAAYRALQEAVRMQAIEAGYEGQAMRKHVAAAVKTSYGALPVSDSPAAVAKRAQRPAATPKAAPANVSANDAPTMARVGANETIESFIARVGMTAALAAAMRILDAVDETKAEAAVIGSVIAHLNAPKPALPFASPLRSSGLFHACM